MFNKIKNAAAQLFTQFRRWGPLTACCNIMYHLLYRERKRRFGSLNPDKTFYVIRGVASSSKFYIGVDLNLLANYSYVISHLLYAQEKEWIPVIDQQNYPVYNTEEFPVNGTTNAWEYYWRQPDPGYTLEEVYQSRNVVLSRRWWYAPGNPEYDVKKHQDRAVVQRFHALTEQIPLNEETWAFCQACRDKTFPSKGTILGVSMRNGGHAEHSAYRAPGHPIQPDREQLLDLVRRRKEEWGMDYVFLATEENANVEWFRAAFGDQLLVMDRERYNGWHIYTKEDPNPLYQAGKKHLTALNYLAEMELLAACDGLISSITSGVRYAIFRNGGRYSHLELLDCGRFPDQRRRH